MTPTEDEEDYMDLLYTEIKHVRSGKSFEVTTDKGTLEISCDGDNSVTTAERPWGSDIHYGIYNTLVGCEMNDIEKVDKQTICVEFDNGKTLHIYDDNMNGAGISIGIKTRHLENLRSFNEEWFWNKKKDKPEPPEHEHEEYRGFDIRITKYPTGLERHFEEDSGKTIFNIWGIPADVGPAYKGEGDMEAAKRFLDKRLYKISRYGKDG